VWLYVAASPVGLPSGHRMGIVMRTLIEKYAEGGWLPGATGRASVLIVIGLISSRLTDAEMAGVYAAAL
jgi:hypothetical protein